MANAAPITLEQLFRFYRNLPHQSAAIQQLEQDLAVNGYAVAMRRDRAWFNTWSQDGKQADLAPALKLIKEFEGCHLRAYPDPLSGGAPWTIGYGTTRYSDGRPVSEGDEINAIEADLLLRQEVDRIAEKLRTTVPFWVEMTDAQKCALISFAYNLGSGFYGAKGFETISKRLREKDWAGVPDALLLYRNPGTNVEAGLKRRRIAEGDLWGRERQTTGPISAMFTPESPFSFKITPHITYGEFALGQEARRFDHQYQCDTALRLAQFMEKVRAQFGGRPVVITSGYRNAQVNRQVGGASQSEHLYSRPMEGAVDFVIQGVDMMAVQAWCDREWPFSLGYAAPQFIHLGRRSDGQRRRWDYA
jgi:GH24 family phage-related lysozyme (muramidase)